MMDCRQVTEDLTAYLDGELGTADSAQVKTHLASCASCADELRSLQEAANFVESHVQGLSLRPGSWNAVRTRIAVEKSPSIFRFPFPTRWRAAFAATACIVIFALGYLWYQQLEERNLNAYISQYIKAREASRFIYRAGTGTDVRLESGSYTVENPFVEAKVGLDINPFRSED
jgi:anti-sigma factor RsiW